MSSRNLLKEFITAAGGHYVCIYIPDATGEFEATLMIYFRMNSWDLLEEIHSRDPDVYLRAGRVLPPVLGRQAAVQVNSRGLLKESTG